MQISRVAVRESGLQAFSRFQWSKADRYFRQLSDHDMDDEVRVKFGVLLWQQFFRDSDEDVRRGSELFGQASGIWGETARALVVGDRSCLPEDLQVIGIFSQYLLNNTVDIEPVCRIHHPRALQIHGDYQRAALFGRAPAAGLLFTSLLTCDNSKLGDNDLVFLTGLYETEFPAARFFLARAYVKLKKMALASAIARELDSKTDHGIAPDLIKALVEETGINH
eukprot:TRINITY_DN3970_c0_g2_i1.p2 TRINITY_DN3970_c0_g2~~TRINITY_DN3970_c0_g2_i1.p2  ORF type:complete len:223 (+),score=31.95 TRINITY_DN3970_c0_g2_i1:621-1289(+)